MPMSFGGIRPEQIRFHRVRSVCRLGCGGDVSEIHGGRLAGSRTFFEVIGGIIPRAAQGNRRVRIFGEMVALLWADGNRDAAIRLEELWNGLQETHPSLLFCAYPMNIIGGATSAVHFSQVCTTHSRVIPAESYMALDGPDNRLRKIAELQQQAISLQAEIAERKRAEEELKQANRRKDEFLAMLAHELRNPLAPILSAVELLRRNGPADPNLRQARNVIERQAQHLTRLVDDLLDTARITQGAWRLLAPVPARGMKST